MSTGPWRNAGVFLGRDAGILKTGACDRSQRLGDAGAEIRERIYQKIRTYGKTPANPVSRESLI